MEAKQIIIVRKDLGMSRGKMAAQVAHASLACILKHGKSYDHINLDLNIGTSKIKMYQPNGLKGINIQYERDSAIDAWLNGKFTKIVLGVDSEAELIAIYEKAKEQNLLTVLITDAGLTEFAGPTNTCVGIGPHFPEAFENVTNHLKTFR
jgi:PTH2 family peptidyl-tRNA hydrolase